MVGKIVKNIGKLWKYSYNYRGCLILLGLLTILGAWLEIRIPMYMSEVLDGIIHMESLSYVARTCLMIGILSLVLTIQGMGEGYFVARWSSGVTRNLSDSLFSRIMSYESRDMDHFGSATALTRLTTDVTILRRALEMTGSLFLCPLLIVFSVISACMINRSLSLVFVLTIPVMGGLLAFIIALSRSHYRKMLADYDHMNQTLSESIVGLRTIKSYAREDEQKTVFEKISDHLRRNSLSAERLAALNAPFSKMAVNLSILALAWLGGRRIIQGTLSVGDLFCLITYTNQILAQLLIISMILVPLVTSQVCLDRILEMLEWDDRKIDQSTVQAAAAGHAEKGQAAVTVRNLRFSYSGAESEALLQDIELEIREREFLGITGTGGAGKTSLIRLIMGLYPADAGTVFIHGRDIRSYDRSERKSLFGYVPQKAQLFSGTIRENLCAGRPEATEEELDRACRNACIDEYIRKQEAGYDTILEEGGTNLSGGQRQRMCLARALLRNAGILVMDNMTSALDSITEARVVNNLRREYAGLTRIVISDRISTIRDADRIFVLDRGRIAGTGTHDELIKTCRIYHEMAKIQEKQIADG